MQKFEKIQIQKFEKIKILRFITIENSIYKNLCSHILQLNSC